MDVITGANTDVQKDLVLDGPLRLVWRRHYDSSLASRPFALGPGHDHEFNRSLRYDVDGMRYEGPLGRAVGFPTLDEVGMSVSVAGYRLVRTTETVFRLGRSGDPDMWFDLADPEHPAFLSALSVADRRVEFRYAEDRGLTWVVDALGRFLQVDLDGEGRLSRISLRHGVDDRDRVLLEYEYDGLGRLVRGIDAYRNEFTFEYDERHRMVRRTDRRGYSFEFDYDSRGRCVLSRGEDRVREVRLEYRENVTVVTRSDGGQWLYVHDGATIGRIVDPYGGERAFTVDGDGKIVEEVDPNGNVTRWLYDTTGQLVGKRSPIGTVLPPDAEGAGVPWPEHVMASCPLEWELGSFVSRESIQPPSATWLELLDLPDDVSSRLRTAEAGQGDGGGPARRVRDLCGRIVREEWDDGSHRRWTYGPNGNVVRMVDRVGSEWRFGYDSWNHLVHEVDPLQRNIRYAWTREEELAAVTDPGGTASEYSYDLKDRLVEVRRAGQVEARYAYDPADNLVEKTDGEGRVVLSREIGPGNLLESRVLSGGPTHRFEYDDGGRYTLLETDDDHIERGYDEDGRRTSETRNGMEVAHVYERGVLASSTVLGRFTTRYEWEPGGFLVVVDPAGGRHRVRHAGYGIVDRHTANGTRQVSQYDRRGKVLARVLLRGGRVVRWRRYTYDAEGRLRERETEDGRTLYSYDAAGRLTGTRDSEGDRGFRYDEADNLTAGSGVASLAVGSGNRVSDAGDRSVEYDAAGRLVADAGGEGQRRFRYDARGMMVGWKTARGEGRARFDAIGRRTAVERDGRTSEYLWDGDRLAARLDPDGGVRIYVYAGPLALTPLVLVDYEAADADAETGRVFSVFTDQVAAPDRVEDEDGEVAWGAVIRPYGAAEVDPERTIDVELRWPGHHHEPGTGLHYNRFRTYDPAKGRYTGPDPIGVSGGLNLYAYTANPLADVDLRGLQCQDHPAGLHPDCEDCNANEETWIGPPPRPPDPATVEACGQPTHVTTWRPWEVPYRHPPEMYEVRPGQPLDVDALDTSKVYLYVVDTEGNVLIAPEQQPGFKTVDGREVPVKHGDLAPQPEGGAPAGATRGEARTGGEMRYVDGEWVMDRQSSYSYGSTRMDGEASSVDNTLAAHKLLTQSGTDTSKIMVKNP